MDENPEILRVLNALNTRRSAAFTCGGGRYLIAQENNKGCDYISIWTVGSGAMCLGRALFDIFDGVDGSAVRELLTLPCIGGHSVLELIGSGVLEWTD